MCRHDFRLTPTRHSESQRQDACGYDDRPTHADILVPPGNMHNLTEDEGRLSWWPLSFCSSRLLALFGSAALATESPVSGSEAEVAVTRYAFRLPSLNPDRTLLKKDVRF